MLLRSPQFFLKKTCVTCTHRKIRRDYRYISICRPTAFLFLFHEIGSSSPYIWWRKFQQKYNRRRCLSTSCLCSRKYPRKQWLRRCTSLSISIFCIQSRHCLKTPSFLSQCFQSHYTYEQKNVHLLM